MERVMSKPVLLCSTLLALSVGLFTNAMAEGPEVYAAESVVEIPATPEPPTYPTPTPTPPDDPQSDCPDNPPPRPGDCAGHNEYLCLENEFYNPDAHGRDSITMRDSNAIDYDQHGNAGWYGRASNNWRRAEGYSRGEQGFRDWLATSGYVVKFNACWNCACIRQWDGCFPPGTQVTMSDGSLKPIEKIRVGDQVLNPLLKQAQAVERVMEGFEKEALIEYGYADHKARVSQKHPVLTDSGMKQARALTLADKVMDANGEFHSLEHINELPIQSGQIVINLKLRSNKADAGNEGLLLADGIVVGDMRQQNAIDKAQSGS